MWRRRFELPQCPPPTTTRHHLPPTLRGGCLGLFTWLAACLRPSVQTAAAGPHAAQIGAGRPVHQHYCQSHNTQTTERVTGGGSGSRDVVISHLTHPWWKGLVNKVQTIILQNASQCGITNQKYKMQKWEEVGQMRVVKFEMRFVAFDWTLSCTSIWIRNQKKRPQWSIWRLWWGTKGTRSLGNEKLGVFHIWWQRVKGHSDIQTEICVISGVFSERIQVWQVDVS